MTTCWLFLMREHDIPTFILTQGPLVKPHKDLQTQGSKKNRGDPPGRLGIRAVSDSSEREQSSAGNAQHHHGERAQDRPIGEIPIATHCRGGATHGSSGPLAPKSRIAAIGTAAANAAAA